MLDGRTLALGLAVFGATFAGGWWLGIGNLASGPRASVAKPVAQEATVGAAVQPAPQASAPQSPARAPVQVAAKPPQGPGLTHEDRLRKPVLILAKAYHKPTCGQDIKFLYVRAATAYAEVLMRSAGCSKFPKCAIGASQLERVWQANRGPLDQPVAEAMASVHAAGGLSDKSFQGDVGRAVRVIAAADFNPGSAPDCVEERASRGTWRVRIRR